MMRRASYEARRGNEKTSFLLFRYNKRCVTTKERNAMTDNTLKKTRRTHISPARQGARRAGYGGAKEPVAEVCPADKTYRDLADKKDVKRGKKYYEAAQHVLNALVAGSTTLVSDMSLLLAENASAEGMAKGWDPDRARSAT